MQDLSSMVTYSPSFSFYASGEFAAAAVKISLETNSVNDEDVDFEFETSPLHEETFVHFPTFTPKSNDVTLIRNKKDDDVAMAWRSTPASPLWSESEEFEILSGNCLWSPLRSSPAHSTIAKPELSSSTPKRCRLKKLLTRSHSDGASKRCCFKDFMKRSHSDGGDASTTSTSSLAVKGKDKTASYSIGEGDKRRKSYLPYRQDLIGVFAGMRRLRH